MKKLISTLKSWDERQRTRSQEKLAAQGPERSFLPTTRPWEPVKYNVAGTQDELMKLIQSSPEFRPFLHSVHMSTSLTNRPQIIITGHREERTLMDRLWNKFDRYNTRTVTAYQKPADWDSEAKTVI